MLRFILLFTLLFSLNFNLFSQILDTCYIPTAKAELNVNNARVSFSRMGYLWTDIDTSQFSSGYDMYAGYQIPKKVDSTDLNTHSIFCGGLWIAGKDNRDSIRVAKSDYYSERYIDYVSGPIDIHGNSNFQTCQAYDRYWTVNDSSIEKQIKNYIHSNHQDIPISNIPKEILEWPAKRNPYAKGKNGEDLIIVQDLAPFIDVDSNGLYNPVKGDFPDIRGDQHIFWVFNDLGRNYLSDSLENLSLEIQANAFAYNSEIEVIKNTTYYSFNFISRGSEELRDVYIGVWVDVTNGYYRDNYVGCDSTRNMGIAYNADSFDQDGFSYYNGYGYNPPLFGVKILDYSQCKSDTNQLTKMSSFKTYYGDFTVDEPQSKEEFYYYLQGLWNHGVPQTIGYLGYGGNTPTKYMFPSNPSDSTGWSMCHENLGDYQRRFLVSLGPFDFKPGDVKKIDFTVVWTRPDSFDCGDFNSTIGLAADQAQAFYDSVICPARKIPVVSSIPSYPNSQLSVYPNPFQDKIHIEIRNADKGYSYQLLDVSGKTLKSTENVQSQNFTITTDELSSGIYFLQLAKDNRVLEVQKLVKTTE